MWLWVGKLLLGSAWTIGTLKKKETRYFGGDSWNLLFRDFGPFQRQLKLHAQVVSYKIHKKVGYCSCCVLSATIAERKEKFHAFRWTQVEFSTGSSSRNCRLLKASRCSDCGFLVAKVARAWRPSRLICKVQKIIRRRILISLHPPQHFLR